MGEGMLGDELRREIVIEIGDAHGFAGGHGRSRSLQSLNSFFWPAGLAFPRDPGSRHA